MTGSNKINCDIFSGIALIIQVTGQEPRECPTIVNFVFSQKFASIVLEYWIMTAEMTLAILGCLGKECQWLKNRKVDTG